VKQFKEYLQEKVQGLSNIGGVKDLIFREGNVFPLSETMFKRIFGDLEYIDGWHVTGWQHIDNMIKLQNTKKSISVFTKIKTASELLNGAVSGGVIFKVSGQKLGGGQNDIMSLPDNQGRRWIVDRESGITLSKSVMKEMDKLKFNMLDIYGGDNVYIQELLKDTKGGNRSSLVGEIWTESRIGIWMDFNGKTKANFIKDYIDGAEKIVKKHKKEFKEALFNAAGANWGTWDEQVINKVKIESVYIAFEDFVYSDYLDIKKDIEQNSTSIDDIQKNTDQYNEVIRGLDTLVKNNINYKVKKVSDILKIIKKR